MGDKLELAARSRLLDALGEDFSRESLGIIDLNRLNGHRESMIFGDVYGRESLGMPNLDSLDGFDVPRESLGIIDVADMNLTFASPNSSSDILDTAFLGFSKDLDATFLKPPNLSSFNVSFHSISLASSVPSTISLASSAYDTTNFLNNAILESYKLASTSLLDAKSEISPLHRRINSLPPVLRVNQSGTLKSSTCLQNVHKTEVISEGWLANGSLNEISGLDDSVFIANHFEEKIDDLTSIDSREYMLDSTQEPEELADVLSEVEPEPEKCDTNKIFKNVDKHFVSPATLKPPDNSSAESNSDKTNRSKSRDALEIISSLSEMFNNGNCSKEQACEAQNLLTDLKDMIIADKDTMFKTPLVILDDSGRSSIGNEAIGIPEPEGCYEILDLRKKSASESNLKEAGDSVENVAPLDLSLKSKSISNMGTAKNKSAVLIQVGRASNYSVSSNESSKSLNGQKKIQLKKLEGKAGPKRGPMKAVIPVDDMVRRSNDNVNIKVTPVRGESKSMISKMKKTSTPISEMRFKPSAQSTPELSLAASPKSSKQKLNYSGANLEGTSKNGSKLNKLTAISRRASSDNLKSSQKSRSVLTRSYSTGENIGISRKSGEIKKPSSVGKRLSGLKMPEKIVLKENTNKGGVRMSPGRKVGKENLH